MRPIRSRAMAFEVAWILKRITGDDCCFHPVFGLKSGKIIGWRVVRTDFAGKEFMA